MDQSIETPLGRYRLLALLGQGGMADVYLACTKGPGGFQKLLVVKLARFTGDPMFSTMFLDEARIAAQLEHPNIVQTYEVGEEASRHYIVMEYLDGANFARLRQRAKKVGGVPLRISIQILHQVLEGLAYAHEARGIDGKLLRVVHRDLTPSNIIVTNQGVVKILDFGIAKAVDTQSFTQTGRYSGKLSYMPPEQLRVESVDGRADIFSVGVILAEAALGERFWGNASGQVIAQQLGAGQLPSLDGVPDLDAELRRICGRALAADREQRYPNASIFKADLLRYLNTLGGPLSREELGDFVCEVVADDRAKLKATIDTQLARISQQTIPIARAMTDLPVIEMTPSDKRNVHTEPTAIKRDATHKDDDIVIERIDPPALPPAPSGNRRVGLIAGIGGGVVLAGVLVFALTRGSSPPAAPGSARLEIIVSPPDAVLKLDGKSLDMNPYAGSLPRDEQVHELVVTATGYEPQTRKFTLDRDLMLQLRLDKAAAPVPPVAVAPVPAAAPPKPVHEPAVATTAPPTPVERPATRATPPRTTTAAKVTHAAPAVHSPTRTAPATTPPAATVAATPPPPPTTTTTAPTPPAVTTTQPTNTTSGKRAIDADVFDKKTGTTKRAIDSNVFDSDKTTKKPTIDRDNPWKK